MIAVAPSATSEEFFMVFPGLRSRRRRPPESFSDPALALEDTQVADQPRLVHGDPPRELLDRYSLRVRDRSEHRHPARLEAGGG